MDFNPSRVRARTLAAILLWPKHTGKRGATSLEPRHSSDKFAWQPAVPRIIRNPTSNIQPRRSALKPSRPDSQTAALTSRHLPPHWAFQPGLGPPPVQKLKLTCLFQPLIPLYLRSLVSTVYFDSRVPGHGSSSNHLPNPGANPTRGAAGKAPPRGARSAERRSAHMGNQECSVKQAPRVWLIAAGIKNTR